MASADQTKTEQLLAGLALADDLVVTYLTAEIRRLATMLVEGEEVHALTTASRHVMPGLLVVTTNRLIFLKRRRVVGWWVSTEIALSTISYVGIEQLVRETIVHVRTDVRRRALSFGVFPSRQRAEQFFRLLKRLSERARAGQKYEA